VQKPDPHRANRPHKQQGGTDVPGFRNPTEGIPGHRLRKDLGQHFLRDERVLDDVITAARLSPTHKVLEIGPGPGNLTQRLSEMLPKGLVIAIEADASLATHLEGSGATSSSPSATPCRPTSSNGAASTGSSRTFRT
jgi:hypothetical protein